jgi:hypothetical protein
VNRAITLAMPITIPNTASEVRSLLTRSVVVASLIISDTPYDVLILRRSGFGLNLITFFSSLANFHRELNYALSMRGNVCSWVIITMV